MELLVERVEEVNDALAKLVLQVKLLALRDLHPALHQIGRALVDILQEVLGCSFQEEDLVVMIAVVGQVAALFADQLVVKVAVSDVGSSMVWAKVLPEASTRVLLVRLRLRLVAVELVLGES